VGLGAGVKAMRAGVPRDSTTMPSCITHSMTQGRGHQCSNPQLHVLALQQQVWC
jgi:hypothetical protein